MQISTGPRRPATPAPARGKAVKPKAKRKQVKDKPKATARKLRREGEVNPCGGTLKSKKISRVRKNRTNQKNRMAGAKWDKVRDRLRQDAPPPEAFLASPDSFAAGNFAANTLILTPDALTGESPACTGSPTRIACL